MNTPADTAPDRGRPVIGTALKVPMTTEQRAAVAAYAQRRGLSYNGGPALAAAVRELIDIALAATEQPDPHPAPTATLDYTAILAEGLREDIIAIYHDQVELPGGWVPLRILREQLPEAVPRTEVDAALAELSATRRIRLIAEVNRKVLTPEDHRACLHIIGDRKDLYQVK